MNFKKIAKYAFYLAGLCFVIGYIFSTFLSNTNFEFETGLQLIFASVGIFIFGLVFLVLDMRFRKNLSATEPQPLSPAADFTPSTASPPLWFVWFVLTAVYTFFVVTGLIPDHSDKPTVLGHIGGFIGLFVPYGPTSLITLILPWSWGGVVFFFVAMHFSNKWLNKKQMSTLRRILYILAILLIITTIVDLLRLTPFESFNIFFNGRGPNTSLNL